MKALITGASSGIGRDMAYYLGSKGYDLILVARRKENLTKIKKDLKNVNVQIIPLDLSVMDNLEVLYNETKDKDVDILINNAGFGLFGEFSETDLETELKMIDLNIVALHYLTKKFLQIFVEKDSGYILNVASSAGFMSGPKLSTYYATKNYVCRLTEAIYQELKMNKSNVHISALCPGPVDTEFNKVAKGTFKTKAADSKYIAKYAIEKMFKGKLIIVPTFFMKLSLIAAKLAPRKIMLRVLYSIQDSKMK